MHGIVKHVASSRFWHCYYSLPDNIQKLADSCFKTLKADAKHPSLHLKKVGKYWSVRIGLHYRAIAVSIEQGFLWIWIGNHSDYDSMIRGK